MVAFENKLIREAVVWVSTESFRHALPVQGPLDLFLTLSGTISSLSSDMIFNLAKSWFFSTVM